MASSWIILAAFTTTLMLYWRNVIIDLSNNALLTFTIKPANDTLGFGAIYAVSAVGSPRLKGLLENANVTRLEIRVSRIPDWTQEELDFFRDDDHPDKSTISDGSIRAWLSHIAVLKEFLESNAETALVIEDGVDWDIRLKNIQIPSTAAAHRSLLHSSGGSYWGSTQDWDLVYLGHCGDYFTTMDDMHIGTGILHPSDLKEIPHMLYRDGTLPDSTDIHPFTASFLNAVNVPAKTRLIYESRWPLCSLGYAVTRHAAHRLLHELAAPFEVPGKWTTAYDIALLEACRDRSLRCFSVTPELFHHMEGTSLIDGEPKDQEGRPPADRVAVQQIYYRNETSNIGCGFWSGDFSWDGNLERLTFLQEEVGRRGRCLKPGRREDGSYLDRPGGEYRKQSQIIEGKPKRKHENKKSVQHTRPHLKSRHKQYHFV
ncbi:hypothetical protein C1H76_0511 [Elsinoe australis]|uniref:Glycosyltransferase family 25 protein n=1 Tax=Elsinoe australis TaxID=40998 RepID=A0A4U7BG97_9PEZI|nr:hypothetical protein C1H76_0511 [Elsinoe australis]